MSMPTQKSPFEFTGGHLALDFANTINRGSPEQKDHLTDYGRLLQWGQEAGLLTQRTVDSLSRMARETPGHAQSILREAIHLREAIADIFLAVGARRVAPSTAISTLNIAVHRASQHCRIKAENRHFAWEWVEPEQSLDSPLWPVSRAAAELLVSEELAYVRECAASNCRWLFVDKTKNHRRRWCEMRVCGNRAKARRYYQRQKAG